MRVLIVGAGGHAQVVADTLWQMRRAGSDVEPIGFLDDDETLHGQCFLDLPVFGTVERVSHIAHEATIVGIGDNRIRRRHFIDLQEAGERFVIARHPTAVVAPDVEIGPGTLICANVVVNTGSVIGHNVILNSACTVDHHNRIAYHNHVAPGAHLGGEVTTGEGVFIGLGASVIPGRRIGPWATVGAAACVVEDVDGHSTVAGIPAKPLHE